MTDPRPDEPPGSTRGWLALREPADARGPGRRALVERLRARAGAGAPLVVHDLGSGTGSMPRWLAPRLPGPQRWVLHDHDPALLAAAERGCAGLRDADGAPGAARDPGAATSPGCARADLAGAGLVTASALLDLLTAAELDALAAACAAAGCPALLTLSVAGRVELDPPDPRDARVRRRVQRPPAPGRGRPPAARPGRAGRGRRRVRAGTAWTCAPRPARGGSAGGTRSWPHAWLPGWVAAAADQRHRAARAGAAGYLADRLPRRPVDALVQHHDLLALPTVGRAAPRTETGSG